MIRKYGVGALILAVMAILLQPIAQAGSGCPMTTKKKTPACCPEMAMEKSDAACPMHPTDVTGGLPKAK